MSASATHHPIRTQPAAFRRLQEAPCRQALVLMGSWNAPNVCWRDSPAGHKQPRRLLERVDNTLLAQVIEERCSAGPHRQGRTGQGKLRILREEEKTKAGPQPWISGEQTLASSGICLGESHLLERRGVQEDQGSAPPNSSGPS